MLAPTKDILDIINDDEKPRPMYLHIKKMKPISVGVNFPLPFIIK